jgi:hypothetical protein
MILVGLNVCIKLQDYKKSYDILATERQFELAIISRLVNLKTVAANI